MKYQAKIENGIVTEVIVATDEVVLDFDGEWISCSEECIPGIGYTYSSELGFRPEQPYSSWVFNQEKNNWEPPISYPSDGNIYEWDEDNEKWKLIFLKVNDE